jgi:hypothetical protein
MISPTNKTKPIPRVHTANVEEQRHKALDSSAEMNQQTFVPMAGTEWNIGSKQVRNSDGVACVSEERRLLPRSVGRACCETSGEIRVSGNALAKACGNLKMRLPEFLGDWKSDRIYLSCFPGSGRHQTD